MRKSTQSLLQMTFSDISKIRQGGGHLMLLSSEIYIKNGFNMCFGSFSNDNYQ